MPWMKSEVAVATLNRKVRYKVRIILKGTKRWITLDRKEIISIMEDNPDLYFRINNVSEAKMDRTFYIYDYGDKPE